MAIAALINFIISHFLQNSQIRLCSIPVLEKEVERLTVNNKNLQDLLGNKLLLEEQVHDLKTRLEKAESAKTDAVKLEVKESISKHESVEKQIFLLFSFSAGKTITC